LTTRDASPTTRSTASDLATAVDAVRRLIRGLRLAEQRTRSVTGLSAAQLFVLNGLQDSTGASLSELADRTLTDRTSVRAVVERPESEGAVRTGSDPTDRRRTLVHITAAGRRRLATAPAPPTVQLLTALRRLTPLQLRRLTSSLGDLIDAMGLRDEPATMLFESAVDVKRSTRRADTRTTPMR
jgi:DNA-binding MarR family transcriptional regulator